MRAAQNIFISYRRDDTAGYARALYDELARRFGAEHVFMDVDDIGAGDAFADVIRRAVRTSGVLLVLIGRRWRGEREGQAPRIDDADDFVRLEVAAALEHGLRVIPVLVDGAALPSAAQLPPALRALAERNALAIDNARFASDVERLTAALQGTAPGARRRWLAAASAAGVVVIAAAVVAWHLATAPARPAIAGAWQAEVVYDWPNARHAERFSFDVDASSLRGSASFLGVPRGIVEGSVDGDRLMFVTRTAEVGNSAEITHRYEGRVVGDEIRFVMQTAGGSSAHVPVEFVARRAGAGPS